MAISQGEERQEELKAAQNMLKNEDFNIICDNPDCTLAMIRVINAIRNDHYQLFKLADFIGAINRLAQEHHGCADYMSALEDIAKVSRDCC